MSNNAIHLDNSPLKSVENIMSGLQTRIKNINSNLNTEYCSYADLLQSAKEQIIQSESKSTANVNFSRLKSRAFKRQKSLELVYAASTP